MQFSKTKKNYYNSRYNLINKKTIKSKSKPKLQLGCHSSIANGILDSIKYVESIGGNALQIFMGNNRSASLKSKHKFKDQDEINKIKDYIKNNNNVLIIHSIYLLNFASSPYGNKNRYMHDNIQYDLKYGKMIGAKCVVLHLGFAKDLERKVAISNLIGNVNHIIKHMPKGIMLSLETSACKSSELGCTLEELKQIWDSIKHNNKHIKRVGFCIDTAHVFVSGYDISKVSGISEYLKNFDSIIGFENITNFHINDSRYELGAKKDEHRGIGAGLIYNTDEGLNALKYIKQICMKHKIPMVLETHGASSIDSEGSHKGEKGYEYEINLIRNL